MTPTLTALLSGYSLRTSQGNPAFCSVHLVETDAGRLVFDCGHAGRRRSLLEALAARGLEPADIGTVVLSHGHWDHVQNVDLFPEARVLVHPAEVRNLADPPAADLGTPRWTRRILDDMDVHMTGDGDEPLPGVRVLDLPGHTPGSIGLAVSTGTGTAVLSADAVPTAEALRTGLAPGHPYDQARAVASVKRVAELAAVVYPGHDAPLRLDAEGVPQYLDTPEQLAFLGRSRVIWEPAS